MLAKKMKLMTSGAFRVNYPLILSANLLSVFLLPS